jgi:ABC-type nitrate/sulfonate/bicarbonate transport system ATPase subunit
VNAATTKISLKGISHEYRVRGGTRPVLGGITFDAFTNDVVGIIGPTGAGKSTLLRIIAGFEQPTAGQALVWSGSGAAPAAPSSRIGYLFQQPALFPWQTIADNVRFGARHSRTYPGRRALDEAADYYLGRVGLADAAPLYPYQVSGGMRARAALTRVFLTRPEILLMDEPFGALDALTRRDMYILLRELISESPELTTVLITHDVDEAITLCNKIAIMAGTPGRIDAVYTSDLSQRHETVAELQTAPDYVSLKTALLDTLASYRDGQAGGARRPGPAVDVAS